MSHELRKIGTPESRSLALECLEHQRSQLGENDGPDLRDRIASGLSDLAVHGDDGTDRGTRVAIKLGRYMLARFGDH